MGLMNASDYLSNNLVSYDDLKNNIQYKKFRAYDDIVITWKPTNEKLDGFGPFAKGTAFPYFVILCEGLPANSPISITAVINIEGVVKPEYRDFA